jgi:hypothetical protein
MNGKHWIWHFGLYLTTAWALCACQPSSPSQPQPTNSAPYSNTTEPENPTIHQNPPASSTFTWPEGSPQLSENDRQYLRNLSERYNNIFSTLDGRPENEAISLGFPTAKEWLDARNISDQELKNRAKEGDVKAKAFYVDRNLQTLENLISSSGAENINEVFQASPAARERFQQTAIDTQVASAELLKFRPSPFSAYMFGMSSAITGGVNFTIPASIAVAGDLGDRRSPDLLQAYSNKVGALDSNAVMSSYLSMRKTAGLK